MKILVLGTDPRPSVEGPWWLGHTILCETCRTLFKLDTDDRPYQDVDETTGQIKTIAILCPICKKTTTLKRPIATTSLTKLAQERQPV